ncbi:MAG: HRDC domain-containing protein, partial [Thermodesulfobacteriota bacterium]
AARGRRSRGAARDGGSPEETLDDAADELFRRLRALRKEIADASGVPAYVVFTDACLRAMAARRPTSEQALLAVPGVGPTKLARYGAAFLDLLRRPDAAAAHA